MDIAALGMMKVQSLSIYLTNQASTAVFLRCIYGMVDIKRWHVFWNSRHVHCSRRRAVFTVCSWRLETTIL